MRIIFVCLLLVGCGGGGSSSDTPSETTYIVAGQSNAKLCDWSYLEDRTGSTVVNISIGGKTIEQLIKLFDPESVPQKPKGIIFVHGEADSLYNTPVDEYVSDVEYYRQSLSQSADSDLTLYISTVGYNVKNDPAHYDELRQAVIDEAKINPKWMIAFNGAKDFPSLGYMSDSLHFDESGCMVMMDSVIGFL